MRFFSLLPSYKGEKKAKCLCFALTRPLHHLSKCAPSRESKTLQKTYGVFHFRSFPVDHPKGYCLPRRWETPIGPFLECCRRSRAFTGWPGLPNRNHHEAKSKSL